MTRLPGLDRIEPLADGATRIGALVRNGDLAHDPDFAKRYPAVAEALLSGASAQLRNAATTAGNLLQRTRCPYFGDTASACNKREPGSGCDAIGGETRLHAILGWSDQCIAVQPSDFCVPLAALDAIVEIEGKAGKRSVPLAEFHRLPGPGALARDRARGGRPHHRRACCPPRRRASPGTARYLKVRDRTSYAFAVVSAAAALRLDGDRITEGRLALGGVALKPWRSREAEAALRGSARHDRDVPPRGRDRTGGCQAVGRQRLQDRTRAAHRRAGPHAVACRHARARARPAGIPVLLSAGSRRTCLSRPIPATAPTSASLSPVARASSR